MAIDAATCFVPMRSESPGVVAVIPVDAPWVGPVVEAQNVIAGAWRPWPTRRRVAPPWSRGTIEGCVCSLAARTAVTTRDSTAIERSGSTHLRPW